MENNNKFTQGDVDAINSFLSLACYNGYEEDITDIMNELHKMFESTDKFDSAKRPDWKVKCGRDKVDEFGGIFWSWLVLRYGDYGTSPRYGWIYKEDAKNCMILYRLFMIQMENMLLSKTIRRYDV